MSPHEQEDPDDDDYETGRGIVQCWNCSRPYHLDDEDKDDDDGLCSKCEYICPTCASNDLRTRRGGHWCDTCDELVEGFKPVKPLQNTKTIRDLIPQLEDGNFSIPADLERLLDSIPQCCLDPAPFVMESRAKCCRMTGCQRCKAIWVNQFAKGHSQDHHPDPHNTRRRNLRKKALRDRR